MFSMWISHAFKTYVALNKIELIKDTCLVFQLEKENWT